MHPKKTIITVLALLSLWAGFTSVFTPPISHAKDNFDAKEIFPGWDQTMQANEKKILGLNQGGDRDSLGNEDAESKGLILLVPKIVEIILAIISPLVVIMCIWSGVLFLTAGGDEEALSKAKRFFIYAVIGFIFIVISFTIVKISANILT